MTHLDTTDRARQQRPRSNPWLVWMGVLAGLPLVVGVMLLLADTTAAGITLAAVGGLLFPLWLTAGAICWQVQQRR